MAYLTTFESSARLATRRVLKQLRLFDDQQLIKEAAADPEKYRLSTVIAGGKPTNYRYYVAWKTKRSEHRWCYASWKNIGGYYLIWYEIETKETIKRTKWTAERKRNDAAEYCRRMADVLPLRKSHD